MNIFPFALTLFLASACSAPSSYTLEDHPSGAFTKDESLLDLRIIETTDLHGNMLNWDYYKAQEDNTVGFNKVASLIRAARTENPNTVLVDNGDLIQGNPLAEYVYRTRDNDNVNHCIFDAMNELGYDAANYGNHEFNYGLDFLRASTKAAKFPYVNANIYIDDGSNVSSTSKHAFTPYVILHRTVQTKDGAASTINIGILGLAPPQILVWDHDKLAGKIKTRDMVDVAQEMVPRMKAEGADIIVAVPHSGMSSGPRQGGEENAANFLTQVDGIDAVMTGHSHAVFPRDKFYDNFPGANSADGTFNGKPLVMAGMYGSHIGVVDLRVQKIGDRWKVLGGRGSIRAIYDSVTAPNVPVVIKPIANADPTVNKAVAATHQKAVAWMDTKIANTAAPITSYLSGAQNDTAIQVMTDAMRWYVTTQVTLPDSSKQLPLLAAAAPNKAGGRMGPRFYTAIPAGDVRRRHVADIYNYSNEISVVRLRGADVKEWLEMSAIGFNTIDPTKSSDQFLVKDSFKMYNLDTVDGLTYEFDLSQPARYSEKGALIAPTAHRVNKLSFQGKSVTDSQEFLVVTTTYRANGGGSFPGLSASKVIYQASRSLQDVITDFLAAKGSVSGVAANTWGFKAVHPKGRVILLTAPEAKKLPQFTNKFQDLGIDNAGFLRAAIRM